MKSWQAKQAVDKEKFSIMHSRIP